MEYGAPTHPIPRTHSIPRTHYIPSPTHPIPPTHPITAATHPISSSLGAISTTTHPIESHPVSLPHATSRVQYYGLLGMPFFLTYLFCHLFSEILYLYFALIQIYKYILYR